MLSRFHAILITKNWNLSDPDTKLRRGSGGGNVTREYKALENRENKIPRKAKRGFEKRLADGNRASLVTFENPNVFQKQVGYPG